MRGGAAAGTLGEPSLPTQTATTPRPFAYVGYVPYVCKSSRLDAEARQPSEVHRTALAAVREKRKREGVQPVREDV